MAALIRVVHKALRQAANPALAPRMQAYMKSTMPYYGVPPPILRQVCHRLLPSHQVATRSAWQTDVLSLWRDAKFREERYVAIALSGDRRASSYQTPAAMAMYEEMIVSGAWWDYVDELAIHRVGPIFDSHRLVMRRLMLRWSRSEHLWKRRTSIICQVALKERLDLDMLYACIEPSLSSREFFLRKAIGWALRQHAWIDPAEVVRYVKSHEDQLSPLSRREALINVEGRRRKSPAGSARAKTRKA